MAIHSISLCSGVGGLDLGVGLALGGLRHICYVEREIAAALGGERAGGNVAAVGFDHGWSYVQIDVQRLASMSLCADKLRVVNGLARDDEPMSQYILYGDM